VGKLKKTKNSKTNLQDAIIISHQRFIMHYPYHYHQPAFGLASCWCCVLLFFLRYSNSNSKLQLQLRWIAGCRLQVAGCR
jgi:hypothetical protein